MAGPYDSRIIAYLGEGVAASRPASLNIASTALGIYYATDTKTLSLWNGSGWDTLIALASAIAAGVVSSNGTVLEGTTLGAGLSWSSDTLSNTGVLQIGTDAGTIHVGGGLSEASGTLSNTGVLVFGGVTGTVTLGAGVSMAGQTLSATGSGGSVTAVAAGTGLEVGSGPGGTITTSGTLNLTAATTAALGGVILPGAGVVFSNGTSLGDVSLVGLSYSGGTLSNAGVLQVGTDTGTIHIGAGLSEGSGTLSNAGVLAVGGAAGSIVLGTNLSLSGQTLNAAAGVAAPGAGLVSSNGTTLAATTLVGASWSSETLTIDPMWANFDFAGTGTAWPASVFIPVGETVSIGATFASSQLFNGVAATGTVDLAVSYIHSGTTTALGDLIFLSTGPTLGSSSAVTLVPGNVIQIAPSTTSDATASDLAGAICLTRISG